MTKKWKTLWQKEKLHVLCNFFFCHYVSHLLRRRQKASIWRKGLNNISNMYKSFTVEKGVALQERYIGKCAVFFYQKEITVVPIYYYFNTIRLLFIMPWIKSSEIKLFTGFHLYQRQIHKYICIYVSLFIIKHIENINYK